MFEHKFKKLRPFETDYWTPSLTFEILENNRFLIKEAINSDDAVRSHSAPLVPFAQVGEHTYVDVAASQAYENLPEVRQKSAMVAEQVLNLAEINGYIDLGNARRTLDFGAGAGGPTVALAQLADLNGGEAEAVDQYPDFTNLMVGQGILDADHVHQTDGIEYLRSDVAAGQYDLITAFMFGPDTTGALSRELLDAARHALAEDGRLLITSDIGTMRVAELACNEAGVAMAKTQSIPLPEGVLPATIVVGF